MKYHLFRIKIEHLHIDHEANLTEEFEKPYSLQITVLDKSYNPMKIIEEIARDLMLYFKVK